jgi:hypothetical protein
MLSDGDEFRAVLCGKAMTSIQGTTATGASLSIVALISSIIAVYNPSAGIAEKIVSSCTLISCESFFYFGSHYYICLYLIEVLCINSSSIGDLVGYLGLDDSTASIWCRLH